MPRTPRHDEPGSWHHVYNRAIARRTLFERYEDRRLFLAQLARAVHRGEIEVHAYCLMGTHYHLLVRSMDSRLAEAMHRIQLTYSRWFNRSRRRDGSLVRGRYGSKLVHSLNYRRMLVQYIDFNPCRARLVANAAQYEWGSAWHYARTSGPPWLERGWVESETSVAREPNGATAGLALSARDGEDLCQLVEARLAHPSELDALDNIVSAASSSERRWMIRKSMLADGTRPGLPLLSFPRLVRTLRDRKREKWIVRRGGSERNGYELALVGLGRELCGQTQSRIAKTLEVSETKVHRLYALHRAELQEETEYALAVVRIGEREVLRGARRHNGGVWI